jgi:hypothetical protein
MLPAGSAFGPLLTLQTAIDTARMALAPNLPLLSVPSSLIMASSSSFCWVGSLPWGRAGGGNTRGGGAQCTNYVMHLVCALQASSTALTPQERHWGGNLQLPPQCSPCLKLSHNL